MIEPAVTVWPSPALTPSRWPTLSRPFFELEPAFLWAMLLLVLLRGAAALRLRLGRFRRCLGLGRSFRLGRCLVGLGLGRLCARPLGLRLGRRSLGLNRSVGVGWSLGDGLGGCLGLRLGRSGLG